MKFTIDPNFFDPGKLEERRKIRFKEAQENLENASYWFPKLTPGEATESVIKLPKTKIIPLDYERWAWLQSDDYEKEDIDEFNTFLQSEADILEESLPLFIKTGVFSNKFDFDKTKVTTIDKLGGNFLDIFYASMLFGADKSAEVVIREYIEDKENRTVIYEGMPLHTEFRVFYDFDKKETVGVANYWHPEVMESGLKGFDLHFYKQEKDQIVEEYNNLKGDVIKELEVFLGPVSGLTGKWSVDVMKNGEDYWLIDMARMEKSALVGQMEDI